VRLLLDEQISGRVAERLRDRGHDVTAATDDPSLRGLSDPDLFEVAQQQGRALVTYNRPDFEAIVREYAMANREHSGLVIVHPGRFPSWEFARLAAALDGLLRGVDLGGSFLVWLQDVTS
jgi:NADPH-dependent 2,4-dienoyl-CoA reductase/sulfur reductase-like enzyme